MNAQAGNQPENPDLLRLRVLNTFLGRCLGAHGSGRLGNNEGLLLKPCRVVHTFFLRQALDVVFLDADGAECHRVHTMLPYRVAGAPKASMVVELPAGYCRQHPDYLHRIRVAMQSEQGQSSERNTLT